MASWAVPDTVNGWATRWHAVSGLTLLLLLPTKIRGPVRRGLRRRRWTRGISVIYGAGVATALALGVVHATGLAHGVGAWSPLWAHELVGFTLIPLTAFHVRTRPRRTPPVARGPRRAFLRLGVTGAAAGVVFVAQRSLVPPRMPARRRPTGSYEIGSHDPGRLPSVYWINDRRPGDTEPGTWNLIVQGRPVAIDELWGLSAPLAATLDCTGGWWSEHHWDAVPLSGIVDRPTGRSVRVTSSTGYQRRYRPDELDTVFLAVGYGGEPLRPGHGAPVRLVVPGRRGPEWVKWVVEVADDDRPAWAQSPLPLS
ncbi:MAG: molybdopterin-dependent oxidoreductase [Acidimicrobiales bacterium]